MVDKQLEMWQTVGLLHDWTPVHFSHNVLQYLHSPYSGQWTTCVAPTVPDLTPADLYLQGYQKSNVYALQHNTLDKLWNVIEVAGMTVWNTPDVIHGHFSENRVFANPS
jgi:hypothetical protein